MSLIFKNSSFFLITEKIIKRIDNLIIELFLEDNYGEENNYPERYG